MPSLGKLLSKFNSKERGAIESAIAEIVSLNWGNLDVKKLKGHQNVFRVRRGEIRIIFTKDKNDISVIAIQRRREDTYKF